jgi:hypothetical protein
MEKKVSLKKVTFDVVDKTVKIAIITAAVQRISSGDYIVGGILLVIGLILMVMNEVFV